ncbi:MAG: O-antigen ligase family protein [Patescibacteria group bacterium]
MVSNKILSWAINLGLLSVLFVPLFISRSLFFPFITGKNFAFRIIVEIIFGLWIWLALRDPAYRPRKHWFNWAVLAFFAILTLATITAVNPYRALWSNYERMEGLIGLLHLGLYFLVLSTTLKTIKNWFWFWHTSIGVSVWLGIYGLFQLAGKLEIHQGGERLDASFGNSSYFAVYLLVHIFISGYWLVKYLREKKAGKKIGPWWVAYLLIIFLQLINLYYTGTRGTILGLLGGLGLTAVLIIWQEKSWLKARRAALGGLLLLGILVGGFLAIRQSDFVSKSSTLSRLASISIAGGVNARLLIWDMSWRGLEERPMLGWGPDNYMYIFNKYYNPKMYSQEQWFDRSHNVFLDWLVSAGILGLLSYLSLFGVASYFIWRKNLFDGAVEKSLLTGLLAGYFIHNFFVFDQLTSYILFFSLLGYFTFLSRERVSSVGEKKFIVRTKLSVGQISLAGATTLGLVLALYFVNFKPIRASSTLIQALSRNDTTGYTASFANFQKVFDLKTFGSTEASEHIVGVTLTVLNEDRYPADFKQNFLKLTKSELEKQVLADPLDARKHLIFGSFLGVVSDPRATTELETAAKLSPNKQTILFELGRQYWRAGKADQALEVFKRAYELEPSFDEAARFYSLALIYGNQVKAAPAELFARAVTLWQQKVNGNQTDPTPHFSLGLIYIALGQKARAIAELGTAAKLNPAYKSETDRILRDLRAGREP